MKRISVYIKGGQTSPSYYRIYQYTNRIKDYNFVFHDMLPEWVYKRYMPVSKQPFHIKIIIMLLIYIRMWKALLCDVLVPPDAIIITRRIIPRIMPYSYIFMLKKIKRKKIPILWDYDDHIIASHEVSPNTFRLFANISDKIFCTHTFLKNLLPKTDRNKCTILPTTDGDMYEEFLQCNANLTRLKSLNKIVNVVWVATKVNLPYINGVAPELDEAARIIKTETNRQLYVYVICNGNLTYNFKHAILKNILWSRHAAIKSMMNAHIGIMPLEDNTFTRGKGGFKLVQYLSVGLPCIGSNVGFNSTVINSDCGILINDKEEWTNAIIKLANKNNWVRYSTHAFAHWENEFSFNKNLLIWKNALNLLTNLNKAQN